MERIHFLDEQRRNRRRSLRFSIFAIVAVALAGIPLCVVVAPLGFGLVMVVIHLLDLVITVPQAWWDGIRTAVFAFADIWDWLLRRPVDVRWGFLALVYVAPGALVMVLAWPFVMRLSRIAGAGTVLNRLPNRAIDPSNFAERQLANVVEEMAVAAGVRPPAVRILETETVNAAAVGLTHDDAVILVTSGFLYRLDREERQAMVAHLVGSVGNGDLEIAATIFSVFETWGLVALLLETPIHRRARTQVRQFVQAAGGAFLGRVSPEQAREVVDPLLGGASYDLESLIGGIENIGPRSVLHACSIIVVYIPVIATIGLAAVGARNAIALFTHLGLGPWLSAMWRARRRLADATAVQLTRNPQALARAVQTMEASPMEVPGGWVANFLFPVWPPITERSAAQQTDAAANIVGMRLEPGPRLERLARLGAMLESGTLTERPSLRERIRNELPWTDVKTILTWGPLALLLTLLVIVMSLFLASLLLRVLWWILGFLRN